MGTPTHAHRASVPPPKGTTSVHYLLVGAVIHTHALHKAWPLAIAQATPLMPLHMAYYLRKKGLPSCAHVVALLGLGAL